MWVRVVVYLYKPHGHAHVRTKVYPADACEERSGGHAHVCMGTGRVRLGYDFERAHLFLVERERTKLALLAFR